MRIIFFDRQTGEIKLKIECQDDLWDLYNIVSKEDVVYARTTRELKSGSHSYRKAMTLGVKVLWTEFQPFTTRLRIHGIVIEHPKEYEVKGHHTLNINIGSEFTLKKAKWTQKELERIFQSTRRGRIKVLLIGIDDDEIAGAILHDYGLEKIFEDLINLPGKRYAEDRKSALESKFTEIAKLIRGVYTEKKCDVIVLTGPSIWKELLRDFLDKAFAGEKYPKIFMEDSSTGGIKGIQEALRRGVKIKILQEYNLVVEEQLFEEFLKYVAIDENRVCFGVYDTEKYAKIGAIEKLYVLDKLLKSEDEELRKRTEEIIREAEKHRAYVKIFSSISEAGGYLEQLGGVAAILRYPIPGTWT